MIKVLLCLSWCWNAPYNSCSLGGSVVMMLKNFQLCAHWNCRNNMWRYDVKCITSQREMTYNVTTRRGTPSSRRDQNSMLRRDIDIVIWIFYNLILIRSRDYIRVFVSLYKNRGWFYVVSHTYITCIFVLISIIWL